MRYRRWKAHGRAAWYEIKQLTTWKHGGGRRLLDRMTDSVGEAFFGRKIPFLELLGARAEHWEKGRAVVSIDVRQELTNSWKFAHGGVVMTLLDVAMGSAARTTDAQVAGIVTVNLTVSFLRPCSGLLRAEGRVMRGGRSLVFCEGEVRDASGEMAAMGMGTFRLKRRMEAGDAVK